MIAGVGRNVVNVLLLPGTVKKAGAGGAKKAAGRAPAGPPREQELSQEEVDAKAEQLFLADVTSGKGRLFESHFQT